MRAPLLSVAVAAASLAAVADAATRTAVVFRHTFRAPSSSVKCAPGITPSISDWNQYSAKPWPDFGTAAQNATVRGLQLTTDFATLLPDKMTQIDSTTSVRLVYHENDRDRETAQALANGFMSKGVADVSLESNNSLFDVVGSGICPELNSTLRQHDCENQLHEVPRPDNYGEVMHAMQNILGYPTANNSAPTLNSSILDDFFWNGYWEGRTCLAASFAEVFLFEYGSRILVGWGGVDLDPDSDANNALFRLLETHCFYRSVNMKGPAVSEHDRSNLANAMLRVLDGGDGSAAQDADENVLTIFVGHDADVDQISTLFGVKFQLKPDNQNAVPPMSGLSFSVDSNSGELTANYIGALWDPQNLTDLVLEDVGVVPAYFADTNADLYVPISDIEALSNEAQYGEVRHRVLDRLVPECVENMVAPGTKPIAAWVIVVCVIAAAAVVAAVIVGVWRFTRVNKQSGAKEPLVARTHGSQA